MPQFVFTNKPDFRDECPGPETHPADQMSDELRSIWRIVNKEAHQRYLEHDTEWDKGYPIGVKCDNCQGEMLSPFGQHREKRTEAPGYLTVLYFKCMTCGEIIFMVVQTTLFRPSVSPYIKHPVYRPHWDCATHNQVELASLEHFARLEQEAENHVKEMIDWM